MKLDVIGVGALNLDRILRVSRIPGHDEEAFITSSEYYPGGSAANTVVGLSRLGLSTGFVGVVGSDDAKSILLDDFRRENVDTKGIKVHSGASGQGMSMVDSAGNRAILIDPGVNDDFGIDDVDMEYLKEAKHIHLSSFICRSEMQSISYGCKIFDFANSRSDLALETQKYIVRA